MATLIEDGWLILTDGSNIMELAVRETLADWIMKPKITHYPGNGHYGLDLIDWYLVWKARGIIFSSEADYDTFAGTIKTWQTAGTFTLSSERNTGGDLITYDGTNDTYTVLCTGFRRIAKLAARNGDIYEIGTASFEQAG